MRRFTGLLLALAFAAGCAGSITKDAYNAEAALVGAYKLADPMRADLCRPPNPVLAQKVCDTTLKILEVQYQTALTFNELLAKYAESKDAATLEQIKAMLPVVLAGVDQVRQIIKQLKGSGVVTNTGELYFPAETVTFEVGK